MNAAEPNSSRQRVVALLATFFVLSLPILSARWMPLSDLPQQLAHIELLSEVGPHDPMYERHLLIPYSLFYILGLALRAAVPPWALAHAVVLLSLLIFCVAVHALAAKARVPIILAVVASTLFYSTPLYWGFRSFVFGFGAFTLWVFSCDAQRSRSFALETLRIMVTGGLLYLSHALFFAFGLLWFAFYHLGTRRLGLSLLAPRLLGILPWLIAGLLWYPSLRGRGYDSGLRWMHMPWQRLAPTRLLGFVFGPFTDPSVAILAGTIVVALAWLLLINRGEQRKLVTEDPSRFALQATAILAIAFTLFLPDLVQNTAYFATRWAPIAAVATILSVPVTRNPPRWITVALAAASLAFAAQTTAAWKRFSEQDASGLTEALDALPEGRNVLGLVYPRATRDFAHRPLIHVYAYAQALRDARVSFTFASLATMPVTYRSLPERPESWTRDLEWTPEHFVDSDESYIDYAIIVGDAQDHRAAMDRGLFEPVGDSTDNVRLYRINN